MVKEEIKSLLKLKGLRQSLNLLNKRGLPVQTQSMSTAQPNPDTSTSSSLLPKPAGLGVPPAGLPVAPIPPVQQPVAQPPQQAVQAPAPAPTPVQQPAQQPAPAPKVAPTVNPPQPAGSQLKSALAALGLAKKAEGDGTAVGTLRSVGNLGQQVYSWGRPSGVTSTINALSKSVAPRSLPVPRPVAKPQTAAPTAMKMSVDLMTIVKEAVAVARRIQLSQLDPAAQQQVTALRALFGGQTANPALLEKLKAYQSSVPKAHLPAFRDAIRFKAVPGVSVKRKTPAVQTPVETPIAPNTRSPLIGRAVAESSMPTTAVNPRVADLSRSGNGFTTNQGPSDQGTESKLSPAVQALLGMESAAQPTKSNIHPKLQAYLGEDRKHSIADKTVLLPWQLSLFPHPPRTHGENIRTSGVGNPLPAAPTLSNQISTERVNARGSLGRPALSKSVAPENDSIVPLSLAPPSPELNKNASDLVAGFLERCRALNLTEAQQSEAIKQAAAIDPAIRAEFEKVGIAPLLAALGSGAMWGIRGLAMLAGRQGLRRAGTSIASLGTRAGIKAAPGAVASKARQGAGVIGSAYQAAKTPVVAAPPAATAAATAAAPAITPTMAANIGKPVEHLPNMVTQTPQPGLLSRIGTRTGQAMGAVGLPAMIGIPMIQQQAEERAHKGRIQQAAELSQIAMEGPQGLQEFATKYPLNQQSHQLINHMMTDPELRSQLTDQGFAAQTLEQLQHFSGMKGMTPERLKGMMQNQWNPGSTVQDGLQMKQADGLVGAAMSAVPQPAGVELDNAGSHPVLGKFFQGGKFQPMSLIRAKDSDLVGALRYLTPQARMALRQHVVSYVPGQLEQRLGADKHKARMLSILEKAGKSRFRA